MDDVDTSSKTFLFIEQFWSFVSVAIAIAFAGEATKHIVAVYVPTERKILKGAKYGLEDLAYDSSLPILYRLWRATISFHPVLVGGLVGLLPLPAANWVPTGYLGPVLWFSLAGALSGQMFEILKRLGEVVIAGVRQRLGVKSERPPPPDPPEDDPAPSLADELEPDEDKGSLPKE